MPMPSNCPIIKPCYSQHAYPCCLNDSIQYVDCRGVCFSPVTTAVLLIYNWIHSHYNRDQRLPNFMMVFVMMEATMDWTWIVAFGIAFRIWWLKGSNLNWRYYDGGDCRFIEEYAPYETYDIAPDSCLDLTPCQRVGRTYVNVLQVIRISFHLWSIDWIAQRFTLHANLSRTHYIWSNCKGNMDKFGIYGLIESIKKRNNF